MTAVPPPILPFALPEWSRRAACRTAPPSIFISPGYEDDEPTTPPPEASAYCLTCPVRIQCLDWAVEQGEIGIWGNTTSYQRRQITSNRTRAKCLSCGAPAPVDHGDEQVCLACGLSWPAT
jgi:WhiB family redox-sensing transcriptional regulator